MSARIWRADTLQPLTELLRYNAPSSGRNSVTMAAACWPLPTPAALRCGMCRQ